MKNYFSDEQVLDLVTKSFGDIITTDFMMDKSHELMNLAVEMAIGAPVGNVFVNKDIVGVAFHSPLNQIKDSQLLYSVKELDN